jgi:tetratricopeptide (TPR) repeat protein
LLEATDDTIHLARAYLLCATIMMSQGNAVSANEQLDRAEKLLGQSPPVEDVAMLKVERARAAAAQGEGGRAVELAREAIDFLGDKNPAEAGTAFWALGEGLALQNEPDGANEAFRRSIDLLSNQRRWREATQACQAWGRMLRKAGREQQALDVLERASELSLRALPAGAGADR